MSDETHGVEKNYPQLVLAGRQILDLRSHGQNTTHFPVIDPAFRYASYRATKMPPRLGL